MCRVPTRRSARRVGQPQIVSYLTKVSQPPVLRTLERPNATGFVEYLARQTSLSAILDQHGSPMGQVIELDNTRLNRAG
jgi:hypothetical protein